MRRSLFAHSHRFGLSTAQLSFRSSRVHTSLARQPTGGVFRRQCAGFNTAKGFEHVKPKRMSPWKLMTGTAFLSGAALYVYKEAFFKAEVWDKVEQKYLCDDVTIKATTAALLPAALQQGMYLTMEKELAEKKTELMDLFPEDLTVHCSIVATNHYLRKHGGCFGIAREWLVETCFAIDPYVTRDGLKRHGEAVLQCLVHVPDTNNVSNLVLIPKGFVFVFQTEGSQEEVAVVQFYSSALTTIDHLPDAESAVTTSWLPAMTASAAHKVKSNGPRFQMELSDEDK